MNTYFATIGENLFSVLSNPVDDSGEFIGEAEQSSQLQLAEIKISYTSVKEKVIQLKLNKSKAPDNIALKLLKLAKSVIVPSLVNLYEYSVEQKIVYSVWKIIIIMYDFISKIQ